MGTRVLAPGVPPQRKPTDSNVIDLAMEQYPARTARRWLIGRLAELGIRVDAAPVDVVVGELAANASKHTSSPRSACLWVDGDVLYIGVEDGEPSRPPRCKRATTDDECFRGLLIVAATAQAWGYSVNLTRATKIVWAGFNFTQE